MGVSLNRLEHQYNQRKELSFKQELELLKGFDKATQIEIITGKIVELKEKVAPVEAYIRSVLANISELPQQEQEIYKAFLEIYLPKDFNRWLKRLNRLKQLLNAITDKNTKTAKRIENFELIKQQAKDVSILNIAEHLGYSPIRKGKNYFINCPFHNDDKPSCCLYPDTNTFYCFGCGMRGDNLDFYMNITNTDFKEALREVVNL